MKTRFLTLAVMAAVLIGAIAQTGSATAQSALFAETDGPYTAVAGAPILFTAIPHSDRIVAYTWDFGDGTSSSGMTVSKAYAVPGVYTVKLTATTDEGLFTTAVTTATVFALNPVFGVPYTGAVTCVIDFENAAPHGEGTTTCTSNNPFGTLLPAFNAVNNACYALYVRTGIIPAECAILLP